MRFLNMIAHWVSMRGRKPPLQTKLQVMVVDSAYGVGFALAEFTGFGWSFLSVPISIEVEMWLESDRILLPEELERLPQPSFGVSAGK